MLNDTFHKEIICEMLIYVPSINILGRENLRPLVTIYIYIYIYTPSNIHYNSLFTINNLQINIYLRIVTIGSKLDMLQDAVISFI